MTLHLSEKISPSHTLLEKDSKHLTFLTLVLLLISVSCTSPLLIPLLATTMFSHYPYQSHTEVARTRWEQVQANIQTGKITIDGNKLTVSDVVSVAK